MRGAGVITLQVLAFAVGLAVICGLIGFLVVHFAGSGDAATGFGWGMLLGGAIVGYAAAAAAPGVHPGRGRRVLGDRPLPVALRGSLHRLESKRESAVVPTSRRRRAAR